MILRLVWRSLVRKPGRSLLLLAGYALGVGVTLTLLSIGSALLESSRDRALVGGGDLTVLPEGLDLETFRTGGVSSLYFTVDQAPFLHRQVLEGPRLADAVAAAAPWMEDQLLHLEREDGLQAVSADGMIPSRAAALGVSPRLVEGEWSDAAADRRWLAPSDSALYAGIDAFHLPPPAARGDSTWAEWHYFNVRLPEDRGWLYLTYMVAGQVPDGRWGGRMLATLVERTGGRERNRAGERDPGERGGSAGAGATAPPGGRDRWRVRTFRTDVPAAEVTFHLDRPDLDVGRSRVRLGPEGIYRIEARVPRAGDEEPGRPDGGAIAAPGPPDLRVELDLRPDGRRYLPPLEVAGGSFPSGYTVPVLRGRASGRVCVGDACRGVEDARAYHDHNWGVWRDVTWEWGQATAGPWALVYGGVRRDGPAGPSFLFLTDSLGFAGLLPIGSVEVRRPSGAGPGAAPEGLSVAAGRRADSLLLTIDVRHARTSLREGQAAEGDGTRPASAAADRFHQLYGDLRLEGRLRGEPVAADGAGFFETWSRGEETGAGEGGAGGG